MIVRIFSFVFELCVISLLTEATGFSHNALENVRGMSAHVFNRMSFFCTWQTFRMF